MKIYSEVTKKFYDTMKEAVEAEKAESAKTTKVEELKKAYDKATESYNLAKEKVEAISKAYIKQVDEIINPAEEAWKKARDAYEKALNDAKPEKTSKQKTIYWFDDFLSFFGD